jgi:hypothetical protein
MFNQPAQEEHVNHNFTDSYAPLVEIDDGIDLQEITDALYASPIGVPWEP